MRPPRNLAAVIETTVGAFADAGLDPRFVDTWIGRAVVVALAALRAAAPQ
jgi:hypothetical protein